LGSEEFDNIVKKVVYKWSVDGFLCNLSCNFTDGINPTLEILSLIICRNETPFGAREN
jgi:hypothetical protein